MTTDAYKSLVRQLRMDKSSQAHQTHFNFPGFTGIFARLSVPSEKERRDLYDILFAVIQQAGDDIRASPCVLCERIPQDGRFRLFFDWDVKLHEVGTDDDILLTNQTVVQGIRDELVASYGADYGDTPLLVSVGCAQKIHVNCPGIVVTKEVAVFLCERLRVRLITKACLAVDKADKCLDTSVYNGQGLRLLGCHKGSSLKGADVEPYEARFGAGSFRYAYTPVDSVSLERRAIRREDLDDYSIIPQPHATVTLLCDEADGDLQSRRTAKVPRQALKRGVSAEESDMTVDCNSNTEVFSGPEYSAVLGKATSFFSSQYGLTEQFHSIIVQRAKKALIFSTKSRRCYIKGDTHGSNNPYIVISSYGCRFKCPSFECSKVPTRSIPLCDLPEELSEAYTKVFHVESSDKGRKAFASGVRALAKTLPSMNLKFKPAEVRKSGVGWVCVLQENTHCPSHQKEHDRPENYLIANSNGCFVGCRQDPALFFPSGASGLQLPSSVTNVLFQYVDKRTFIVDSGTLAGNTPFIDEIKDETQHFEDAEANRLFKSTFRGTHSAYAKYLYHSKGALFICNRERQAAWHVFNCHRWKYDPGAAYLMRYLSSDENLEPYLRARKLYSQGDEVSWKIAFNIDKLITSFQNHGSQRGFVDECALFFNERSDELERNLDGNRYLIGFANGVFDLRERMFRKGEPNDYVSMTVHYEYGEPIEEDVGDVLAFISKILPDDAVRHYVLKLLGSCVSGDTRDEKFHVWIGGGANGKSTLLSLVAAALGQYAASMKATMLTQKSPPADNATPGMNKAVGARMVAMQETNSGESVNESLLKSSLGGDKIDYRPLFKEAREFYPHFKMILCTNNPLTIKGTDHGIWRKIRMVPFESQFVAKIGRIAHKEGNASVEPIEHLIQDAQGDAVFEMDKSVKDKIDGPWKVAFMHMLIRYYYVWQEEGLDEVPDKIAQYNRDYKESQDMVGKFLEEKCQIGAEYKVHSKPLWEAFFDWQKTEAHQIRQHDFSQKLKRDSRFTYSKGVDINGKNSCGYAGLQVIGTAAACM
ncbi:uncharacterized protein EV422DRAFT_601352 [Fimicolochytrium jonesii]|uniref:uncharacterized protein n=1 Tax=Fimicolochytrium jonesii TaxID=1396493 RepID=UPI0022FDB546|nr:uncharacterized protein EV422DRAFT_601352 [Fimicolochytrium jonesii]KAI8826295.1 hypothetical protein EV422DRAFT_601352 [Fimicolochytrium jonesii]